MASYALAAIGRDRPGIVAAISRVLFDLGCNLEDSSMTLLRGNFAIMLILAAPDDLRPDGLEAELLPVCRELGLTFDVLPVDDRALVAAPTHHVSVYGADKAGIVSEVTAALAAQGVNVCDLSSRLVGEPGAEIYAVMLDVALPAGADPAAVAGRIAQVAERLGVDASMREVEDDVL